MMVRDQLEQLNRRLRSEAERAFRMDRPSSGRFLTGSERPAAIAMAKSVGICVSFDGGYEDAERVQVCFHPQEDAPEFTAVWLEISWNGKFAHLEHKDLYGSLMALGIDRSYFGDLIAGADKAWLYAMPEVAARLPMEWTSAGRDPIRVCEVEGTPEIQLPEGQMQHDTVASLRLDSVLSAGMRLSRAKAAEMIREGLVQVDHLPEERTDRLLTQGQLLSIRGFGRIRLTNVGQPSRKDRLPIDMEIFSKKR